MLVGRTGSASLISILVCIGTRNALNVKCHGSYSNLHGFSCMRGQNACSHHVDTENGGCFEKKGGFMGATGEHPYNMHITEPWLPGSCIVTLARGMQRHGQPYTLHWHTPRYTRLTHLVYKLWGMLHSMVAYTLWPSDPTCTPPPLASRFQQALALGSTTSLGSKT